jgi:4-amino-4-deoxy-L-arabinose transferase-like glycosyltransferase
MLMTIDGPMVACWALCAWCGYGAMVQKRWWCWPALGLVLAVGVLFKYTILLVVPGLLWWAVCWRKRASLPAAGVFTCVLLAMLAMLPVIVWNWQNDGATVRHLLGHLGFAEGKQPAALDKQSWHYNPAWTLTLLGSLLVMVGVVLVLGLAQGLRAWRRRDERTGESSNASVFRAGWMSESFLLACSLPVLIFYLLVSLIAEPEGNWPIGTGVTLTVLAAMRMDEALRDSRASARLTRWLWHAGVVIAIVISLASLRLDLLARVPGMAWIPVGRFTNAKLMGEDAAVHVQRLRETTGQEPFIIANHYGRASQLWYYMPGKPMVYCSSSLMPGM